MEPTTRIPRASVRRRRCAVGRQIRPDRGRIGSLAGGPSAFLDKCHRESKTSPRKDRNPGNSRLGCAVFSLGGTDRPRSPAPSRARASLGHLPDSDGESSRPGAGSRAVPEGTERPRGRGSATMPDKPSQNLEQRVAQPRSPTRGASPMNGRQAGSGRASDGGGAETAAGAAPPWSAPRRRKPMANIPGSVTILRSTAM
jgi:hypothetical protein